MPVPPPMFSLAFMVTLTAVAWIGSHIMQERRRRMLSALAREVGMHYSARDRLLLTPRVAASLSIIGAAAVRVTDVFYRSGATGHVYIFTAEYTAGVIRGKKRIRRVASFAESRERTDQSLPTISLAPDSGDTLGQYRALLATLT